MTIAILTTKLHIPSPRPDLVSRLRLIERLNIGLPRKLTIISAPAGFGKSTLLSSWAAQMEISQVAWLSLDEGDNDLIRFLTYFIKALQTIDQNIGQRILNVLLSPGGMNVEIILTTLINEIAKFSDEVVLVLDDYHVIETPSIDQAVSFLLDHLPSQFHLIIASRIDPSLPLSRLRARGQMTEVRASDLRFTQDEAIAFLNQVMGLDLSVTDVFALGERTEGWIAGLQLAANSLQGLEHDNKVNEFIKRFTGSDRYIHDYLTDEVLQQQTKETIDFLLQTSILNRMSASLCDAVYFDESETYSSSKRITAEGNNNSQNILEYLEAANLFIVPLDNERQWYRYHHLFADLLYHRLTQTYPDQIEDLHARASHWLEKNGFQNQAIKHAFAMEDKHLAADLIEQHAKDLLLQGAAQVKVMLAWFTLFPKKILRERPLLEIYRAWTLVYENPFKNKDTVEQILSHAQGLLENVELNNTVEKTIAGNIASMRGLLSQPPIQTDHDPHQVLALFHKALDLIPLDQANMRCGIHIGIAYEYMHLENTEAALKANQNAFIDAQATNNHLVAVVALRNQAMIAYHLGELTQAAAVCQKGFLSLNQHPTQVAQSFPSLEILSIAKGYLLVEGGELEKAEIELSKGFETLQFYKEYETDILGHIALTRLLILKGETDKARQTIKQFKQQKPHQAAFAEMLLIQIELLKIVGNPAALETIRGWIRENQPIFEMETDFLGISPWAETRHLTHLTWIQAQIVLSHLETVSSDNSILNSCLDYLNRRIQSAEQNGLVFRVIECLILKSLALDILKNTGDAVDTLSQALSLAKHEGFYRVFIDKGQPMIQLLKCVSKQDPSIGFIRQLLATFERLGDAKPSLLQQNMAESLSERELEVLQLIAQGLTNREISERLYLALDTVKGHNRRVFGKLGVQNRTEAVTCARELGIL